jgi:hypothetical protein
MNMNDQCNIFNLYVENTTTHKPTKFTDYMGTIHWRLNGKFHRDGAPAIERANGTKFWYQHDELHREDGPAIEYADGTKSWYLQGNHYRDAKAWAKAVLKMHSKPHDAAAVEDYLRGVFTKEDLI